MTIFTLGTLIKANGNGSVDSFDTDFKVVDETHLNVYVVVSGVAVLQTLGSEYTVSNVGNPTGCTVTFVMPPAVGVDNVILERQVPLEQSADYIENDEFPSATHEEVMDIAYMALQEMNTRVTRALSVPITAAAGFDGNLPTPEPLFLLAWAADGLSLVNIDPATLDIVLSQGSIISQTHVGDGVTVTFGLNGVPVSSENLEVFVSGVRQTPGVDYTVSANMLTFVVAPPDTVPIYLRWATSIERAIVTVDSSIVTYDGTGPELTVEAQLDALYSAITLHIANANAHPAINIDNTPSGNLAAATVQGALNELQGDIDAINTELTRSWSGNLFGGSRTTGVTYTNTTGKDMEVIVSNSNVSGSLGIQVLIGGVQLAQVAETPPNSFPGGLFVGFTVPDGVTYRINVYSGGFSTGHWAELS